MSSKTTWTCDGCGQEIKDSSTKLPEPWAQVEIRVGFTSRHGGGGSGAIQVDLCSFCQTRLDKQVDPRRWPRQVIDSAAAQAAMDQHVATEGAKK